jgi:hypothetical protein
MSDTFHTTAPGAHAVFSGEGTQYVYFNHPGRRNGLGPSPLAIDHLEWLKRRFIRPVGYRQALDVLDGIGTVLVDGAPGGGRNAAARMLLFDSDQKSGGLQEVLPEDNEGRPFIDRTLIDHGQRLLLDLSAVGGPEWRDLHRQLPAVHETVRERGARLAVVLPSSASENVHPELGPHLVTLRRPDTENVLLRGLRWELPWETASRRLPDGIKRYLGGDPPLRDVARLCRLVAEAHRSHRSGTFDQWCATALSALGRRPEDVARRIVALEDSRQRALLLTAAMLEEATSDAVYAACEALLKTVEYPEDERPLLEREDLSERFREIKAIPDANGRVRFGELDYAPAVRSHFWNHMPGLRPKLLRWVSKGVSLAALTDQDRMALAERLAEQVLRTGGFQDLVPLITGWAGTPGQGARLAAWRVLAYGVDHPRHGRDVRTQLYRWATDRALPDGLAQVITDVCAGPLAERFPERALVRLHHLARRRQAGRDAEERLVGLLDEPRLRRLMLDRLASSLPRHRHPVDVRLFLRLTDPVQLATAGAGRAAALDDSRTRQAVTSAWGALIHRVPSTVWSHHLLAWLTAAHTSENPARDRLLDTLVDACAADSGALGRLYSLALRHPVEPVLFRKINAAQGIPTPR